MKNDATEAALGLLGLTGTAVFSTVPLKRPAPDDETTSDSINCICGFGYDDGFSIACDDCSRWCHAACFDIVEGGVPEEWRCWVCVPRPVDRERAIRLQKERQRLALHAASEKRRRQVSPGVERRQRRQSALAIEGGGGSKRKRRASATQPSATEDEHINIDEPWTHSYVPIVQDIVPHEETRDKLRRQAQHWRGVTALSQPPTSPLFDTTPIPLSSLPSTSPTTLHALPTSSFSHPVLSSNTNPSVRPPSYAVHTTHPIPSAKLIAPYTSTIIPSSAYLADPLNAYAHHGMPKPFVHLFGPPLDVALDARITGNEARFVRSGCRPNAVLRPVICPQAKESGARERADACEDTAEAALTFGVFALRDLKANEEVVLGWEWDDGNAVHHLPALIESPQMFHPHQIHHFRHQMTAMLHALSSTFTTCACGSKAKDCALNVMAAFVDGLTPEPDSALSPSANESNQQQSSRKVDLGPLIGVQRGFRTREKLPMSGGMGGVEMVSAGPSSSILSDRRNMVDSTSTMTMKHLRSVDATRPALPELRISPATASPSSRKDRKGKGRAQTNGIEESLPKPVPNGTTLSNRRRRRATIDKPTYRSPSPSDSSIVIDSDEEQKMPPKMRKRWIHRSSEGLRATSVSASPSGSMISLGSVMGSAEGEEIEVDHMFLDAKEMPPPPMPAILDPTTISSIPNGSPASPSPRITTGNLHAPQASPSPSTPFANLSLLSPGASGTSYFPSSTTSPLSPKLSTSAIPSSTRLSQNGRQNGAEDLAQSTAVAMDDGEAEPPPDSSPDSVTSSAFSIVQSPLSPSLLPPSLPAWVHDRRHASPAAHDMQIFVEISSPCPTTLIPAPSTDPPPFDTPEARPPTPTTPPPVERSLAVPVTPPLPPAPKVKMSLKDFAMRKKRQREEELAKTSPPQSESPMLADEGMPAFEAGVLDVVKNRPVEGPERTNEDERIDPDSRRGDVQDISPSTECVEGAAETTDGDGAFLQDEAVSLFTEKQRCLANPIRVGQRTEHLPWEHQPTPDIDTEKSTPLEAKQEGADGLLFTAVNEVFQDSPWSPTPSPPPEDAEAVARASAQEDGEIASPAAAPRQQPALPRSHTPPTQPRSLRAASAISPSPTPTPTPHRLPPSSSYRTPSTYGTPPSRPPPSGPRALRAGMQLAPVTPHAAARPLMGSQYIPRGPSADRDRKDWGERERGWTGMSRGRGRGTSSTWGR